jgi:hypothetical protein
VRIVQDPDMGVDYIRYDILTQEALRGVVRTVLSDAAAKGLPGEHHFFVSFDTHADGVKISPRLLAQYPDEMTIVLQHQFWDLTVTQDGFEVGLSFNGIPERLVVPLAAITAFVDPSVQFGLKFAVQAEATEEEEEAEPVTKERPPARHERVRPAEPPPVAANPAPLAKPEDEGDKPQGGGEVVRLDRFRKK